MVSESGAWKPLSWLTLNGMIGYSQTTDFASRIYVYERGPLYSFSFPAFFGKGMHYSLFVRADLSSHLMIILRSSTTHYFDRDHISSGLQQVNSSTLSGLDIQLRWRVFGVVLFVGSLFWGGGGGGAGVEFHGFSSVGLMVRRRVMPGWR